MRAIIIAGILAAVAQVPAEAGVVLWRTLEAGDTPDAAKAKLETMPEVKRVKNETKKNAFFRQDINMNEGGVPIFDGHFSISTGYRDGQLSIVKLTSGRGCSDDAHAFARKIEGELLKKYPISTAKLADDTSFRLRALDATAAEPTKVTNIYLNDEVATLFSVTFYREDPPRYYGGSALARSLYNLSRNQYEQRANACRGMGYLTGEIGIAYITRDEYERRVKDIEADDATDRQQAAENL